MNTVSMTPGIKWIRGAWLLVLNEYGELDSTFSFYVPGLLLCQKSPQNGKRMLKGALTLGTKNTEGYKSL